jgi:hypothetical protein
MKKIKIAELIRITDDPLFYETLFYIWEMQPELVPTSYTWLKVAKFEKKDFINLSLYKYDLSIVDTKFLEEDEIEIVEEEIKRNRLKFISGGM